MTGRRFTPTLRKRMLRSRDWLDEIARRSPARLALVIFALVIAGITALLQFPHATASGERADFSTSLFTATSAVSVTGLTTVDTASYWSTFGQTSIMVGMMAGGLGIMTLASILGFAVTRRIGLTQRMLTANEARLNQLGEVGVLIRAVIIVSLILTTMLSLVFLGDFRSIGMTWGEAAWNGWFMAVSVFNNAGFVILPDGLAQFAGDWGFGIPVILGTFLGSLGFPVLITVAKRWRRPSRWSLHAKLTISTTVVLWLGGSVLFGLFEWNNPATIGDQPIHERVLNSMFMSMTTRSSGLSTVDVAEMDSGTWLLFDALMFVGGGSASTGGGIKVTTFVVLVLAILAEARGDRDVEAFGRRIGSSVVRLAIAIAFAGATMVGVASLLILFMTDLPLDVVLFETISAFATCGLSTGITADLPPSAHYVLVALMFAGRTGTMTLAAALALRERRRVIRLPGERPIIG